MWEKFKSAVIRILTSRATIMVIVAVALAVILIYRLFNLQIVHGSEYMSDFMLQTKKIKSIPAARGNIYDRNGILLAYNELAYCVKIEDVYDSGDGKNAALNATLDRLVSIIEECGDMIVSDFGIMLDENADYAYVATDETKKLRFIADIYGKPYIKDLTLEEQLSTAADIIDLLATRYELGETVTGTDGVESFRPGWGYEDSRLLDIINLRYAMSLTAFQKYMGTLVARDVNERTRAVVMENSAELPGVTIEEESVRRYVDSTYFAQIIGYTGKISTEELETLNAECREAGLEESYTRGDIVGKAGIESSMELKLQGTGGVETVYVNNTGKVIGKDETESWNPQAGNDIYLTIDHDLQMAVYDILEQQIAGILLTKIRNVKEYTGVKTNSTNIYTPIYDVYAALFDNSVIKIEHMAGPDAGDHERAVYAAYEQYKAGVYDRLRGELEGSGTAYSKLAKEYQIYESNIVDFLGKRGILNKEVIDVTDETYNAWKIDETASLSEFLRYAVSTGWVDVTKLGIDSQYVTSDEVYEAVIASVFNILDNTADFQRKLFKYMLSGDILSPKDVCFVLCEQGKVYVSDEDMEALYGGRISAYDFIIHRIKNLDITPADLALDPCNGSCVILDPNNGQVRAIVSYPSYDNNKMANSVDAKYYATLQADKSNPLLNYATQYRGAPGSAFKMVTATAALMEGVVNMDTIVRCQGTFTAVTPSPRCWIYPGGHGNMNVTSAITNSCNVFFYQAGYDLSTRKGYYDADAGIETLANYASMYGLGEKTGIEMAEYDQHVSDELPVQSAIGQGTNAFTTVGLARYVATVANSGTCYNLTLVDHIMSADGLLVSSFTPSIYNRIEMPQDYWDCIHKGMRGVVRNIRSYNDLSVEVAGKTGTAQEVKTRPNHALFICYAPYKSPELAIATRIAYGYAANYAAQTTKEILKYCFKLDEEHKILSGNAGEIQLGGETGD